MQDPSPPCETWPRFCAGCEAIPTAMNSVLGRPALSKSNALNALMQRRRVHNCGFPSICTVDAAAQMTAVDPFSPQVRMLLMMPRCVRGDRCVARPGRWHTLTLMYFPGSSPCTTPVKQGFLPMVEFGTARNHARGVRRCTLNSIQTDAAMYSSKTGVVQRRRYTRNKLQQDEPRK